MVDSLFLQVLFGKIQMNSFQCYLTMYQPTLHHWWAGRAAGERCVCAHADRRPIQQGIRHAHPPPRMRPDAANDQQVGVRGGTGRPVRGLLRRGNERAERGQL